jgi:hypothetical protein
LTAKKATPAAKAESVVGKAPTAGKAEPKARARRGALTSVPTEPPAAGADDGTRAPLKAVPAKATKNAKTKADQEAAAKAVDVIRSQSKDDAIDYTARAERAKATRAEAEASGATRTCEGTCKETKAMTAFPTTGRDRDGVMKRGKICRACQRAGRAAQA